MICRALLLRKIRLSHSTSQASQVGQGRAAWEADNYLIRRDVIARALLGDEAFRFQPRLVCLQAAGKFLK